jgi:phospholipid/cholesterol/gamma-HCH transport system ATP-binding protein
MPVETPLIEFRDVTKRFGDRTVLDRVNLKIYENQIATIMGKSGAGKSVLLKHFIGLLSPDAGTIFFLGRPLDKMGRGEWDRYRSQISYLFQNNALFDSMTVFDNIALPLRQTTNLSRKEIEQKVMARIEQTELTGAADKYPSELSGGMQKRVALARSLVTDPKIVLFDEPTAGQDPIRKNAILSMIAHYRKKFGFTAVLVSHDIPDVFFISDRIILLWEGRIAFQGSYEEATRLDLPMAEEFLRSLEGLQDELTGLLSKQMFKAKYAMTLDQRLAKQTVTAVLFSVELDLLTETVGPLAAAEIVKALGKYIDTNLGALEGFSVRNHTGQIVTILPYTDLQEAQQLVDNLGNGLQKEALSNIQTLTQAKIGARACFEIYIYAGVSEANSDDDIDNITERARATQKIIGTFRCDPKGGQI